MRKVQFSDYSKEILEQLQKGAFLTVKDKDENLNTMTISWGSIGYMWNRPVFTVMVRYSRHTYDLIENSNDFTVSFPKSGALKEELGICGVKSGRDIDKFKECNITPLNVYNINTPVVKECDIHIGCKIVYKQAMAPESIIDSKIKEEKYSSEDYHVLYYGEIVDVYISE